MTPLAITNLILRRFHLRLVRTRTSAASGEWTRPRTYPGEAVVHHFSDLERIA